MKTIFNLALVGIILLAGCNKSGVAPTATNSKANMNLNTTTALSSTNGSAGIINIYYDAQLFMMNLKPFTDQPASSLLAHNKSINILYESDGFVTVTNAIQGDGYNVLWQEVDIVFNGTNTPHQFFRDDDIVAAASGTNPEITLVPTNEIYRCAILQHTKPQ
ncbi:MAG TPA: hypothetical protein VIM89_08100 [Mucilaginibacter sp.]